MYYENEKMIVDRNTAGNSYIIDVESGFKAEFNIIRGIAYCWPDGITEKDIERAKADNLDVSKSYIGRIIKNTEKKLDNLEEKLHIYKNRQKLKELLEYDDINKMKKKLQSIIEE